MPRWVPKLPLDLPTLQAQAEPRACVVALVELPWSCQLLWSWKPMNHAQGSCKGGVEKPGGFWGFLGNGKGPSHPSLHPVAQLSIQWYTAVPAV